MQLHLLTYMGMAKKVMHYKIYALKDHALWAGQLYLHSAHITNTKFNNILVQFWNFFNVQYRG